MTSIEGYPAESMHGQFLAWGRANTYAPALIPSDQSLEDIRQTQAALIEVDPDATLVAPEKLHATLLYCPPRYIFEAVCKARGREVNKESVEREVIYYVDIANALGSSLIFAPKVGSVAVDSLNVFDSDSGTAALKLTDNAYLSTWRKEVRDLTLYNLRNYGWVDKRAEKKLRTDPKLKWLFDASTPHVTIAHNVQSNNQTLSRLDTPGEIAFDRLNADSPRQFLGVNSFRFDPELAFETSDCQTDENLL